MLQSRSLRGLRSAILAGAALLAVIGAPAAPALAQEAAVAPEKNPPGDIPDSQVFVTYAAPQGFALKVPEGWGRTDTADGAAFADKYGRVEVGAVAGAAPTAASVKGGDAATLAQTGHAVKIASIKDITVPAGPAVRIVYQSNSEPNAVTGKRIRLENERTLIGRDGKVASITVSAPLGADNVDQWKLMVDSFRWK